MNPNKPMRLVAGVFSLLLVFPLSTNSQTATTARYHPATVISCGDIPYPPNARTPGMVTLDVTVDASGVAQKVLAARDVPPLTKAAEDAVNTWKFAPATKGGQPVPGVVRINVVFNPFNPGGVAISNKPLPAPENSAAEGSGAFQPADIKSANYAVYPPNTVAAGTVVLDVKVGADGGVLDTKILCGVPPLSSAATGAVEDWTFTPGSFEGKPVDSHEVVAFVFVPPALGTM